jgi:hypothetical protein
MCYLLYPATEQYQKGRGGNPSLGSRSGPGLRLNKEGRDNRPSSGTDDDWRGDVGIAQIKKQ